MYSEPNMYYLFNIINKPKFKIDRLGNYNCAMAWAWDYVITVLDRSTVVVLKKSPHLIEY
jgi:hypothetical protein